MKCIWLWILNFAVVVGTFPPWMKCKTLSDNGMHRWIGWNVFASSCNMTQKAETQTIIQNLIFIIINHYNLWPLCTSNFCEFIGGYVTTQDPVYPFRIFWRTKTLLKDYFFRDERFQWIQSNFGFYVNKLQIILKPFFLLKFIKLTNDY